jgi:cell division protein ZapE
VTGEDAARAPRALVAAMHARARQDGLVLDTGQRALVEHLAALGSRALRTGLVRGPGSGPGRRPRGLYVHGPAGRGKTWVADAFFAALPGDRAVRFHSHRFFDDLHRRIHALRSAGSHDAVARALSEVVAGRRLLLFDELHVHDAGNAQLLTRLLEQAFDRGVTVVATSNYAPSGLLPHPLWHHTVERAIALIEKHMDVHLLDGDVDYRTLRTDHRTGFAAGSWRTGPGPEGAGSPGRPRATSSAVLPAGGRRFDVVAAGPDGLHVTFDQLCVAPTSTVEFLAWAARFPRWTISAVPLLDQVDAEAQQRFVDVVDVLVDAGVPTDFVADVPLAEFLDSMGDRPDAFRTASRLRLLAD